MRQDLIVSRSILMNTSPDSLWKTLTSPELIKEYLFGTETLTDWIVGHEIVFQGEYQGHKYRDHGVILDLEPNKRLSYSYWSGFTGLEDKPENYSEITYILAKKAELQVEFTWMQRGFANEEGKKHSESGMDGLLEKIKSIAERL
jgi:uncharacterized protein YndB with AHSA1/START domain